MVIYDHKGVPCAYSWLFKSQILEPSRKNMDDSKEVVFQQLLLDLQDPNATIREEARWELEDIADNRSIEPLIDYYTNFGVSWK